MTSFFCEFNCWPPKDHRKIPQAYYTISLRHFIDNKGKSREYYQKGLKSEMNQLPCFIPYESPIKEQLSLFFENVINNNSCNETSILKQVHIREAIANDFRRISLIIEHREYEHTLKIINESNNGLYYKNTAIPPKKQALNSVIGLKPIFLRDIDFTKDHILDNCVLSLKSIEIPTISTSISFVCVDDHNVAERIAIYNFKEDRRRKEEIFQIGCRFSIINPYLRIAHDGK